MTTLKITCSLAVVGALVVTAACGESKSSMNPVAPSAVVTGAQSDESGDPRAVSGVNAKGGNGKDKDKDKENGNGNDNGNGKQPTVPSAPQPPTNGSPSTTRKVEIEGVISAKSGDSITVNAQAVTVPSTCEIRHGNTAFTFADLHVGDRVHVKGQRTTNGTGAAAISTIEASEVKLQHPGEDSGSGEDLTPLVSVVAFDYVATETAGNTGTFRLTRAGSAALLAAPLTVSFTLAGTATNGTDYNLPLTATFLAGHASVDLVVLPIADGVPEDAETVNLTLTNAAPYYLGVPDMATVSIFDSNALAGAARR